MTEPGLTIVPPGPDWGAFLFTLALFAVALWGFVYNATALIDQRPVTETRGADGSISPVMNA
jgi:hypothetical protein